MTASISAVHLLAIVPLFLYVGIQREKTPTVILQSLALLGAIILAYHAYRIYTKMQEGRNPWVNWIHVLLIAPLLLWIGYFQKETPRLCFELLLMLAFSAAGYHAYYLIRESFSV